MPKSISQKERIKLIQHERKERLEKLLSDIKPELQCYIDSLTKLWPGTETLTALHRNESLMSRINKELDID